MRPRAHRQSTSVSCEEDEAGKVFRTRLSPAWLGSSHGVGVTCRDWPDLRCCAFGLAAGRSDLFTFRRGSLRNTRDQELDSSYPETSGLSWPWLTFRVLTTDLPALPPRAVLPRQRDSHEQSAPPMNLQAVLRRVSTCGSDLHRTFHRPAVLRPRPSKSASRSWSSTLYSATSLLTVFQARTSMDFNSLRSVSLSGSHTRLIAVHCPPCC